MIDDDNHSKIFISEKYKYYIIHGDNKLIWINIFNSFKGIQKSYETIVIDLTDNYYNIDKSDTKKDCTILLRDDIKTIRIFIFDKDMCYTRYDDDEDDCNESVYYKILNDFDCIEKSYRNSIANLISNDNYKHDITLLVDDSKTFIFENDR